MYFNDKDAVKYGVDEAIIIQNIRFWLQKNRANGKHYYDGKYWTYNSKAAFAKLFPFWSEKQIRRILDSLRNQGVLIVNNYNSNPYDKTLWYSFSDQSMIDEWGKQACEDGPEGQLRQTESPARSAQTGQSITDINTDNKTNTTRTHVQKKESIKSPILFDKFWLLYNKKTGKANTIKEWNKIPEDKYPLIIDSITNYLKDRPDPKFRKDPERYLKHKVYEDEAFNDSAAPEFMDYS